MKAYNLLIKSNDRETYCMKCSLTRELRMLESGQAAEQEFIPRAAA